MPDAIVSCNLIERPEKGIEMYLKHLRNVIHAIFKRRLFWGWDNLWAWSYKSEALVTVGEGTVCVSCYHSLESAATDSYHNRGSYTKTCGLVCERMADGQNLS